MPDSRPDTTVAIVDMNGDPDMTVAVIGDQVVSLVGSSPGDVLTVQAGGDTVAPEPPGTPGPHAATHEDGGADEVTLAQSQITGLVSDLALKAPLASPVFTGNPTAPTPTPGDNDTTVATTAFVAAADAALVIDSIADADATHAPSRNAVFDALALKAPLASPTFTGTVNTAALTSNGTVTINAGGAPQIQSFISGTTGFIQLNGSGATDLTLRSQTGKLNLGNSGGTIVWDNIGPKLTMPAGSLVATAASASASAGLRVPHGAAPSSPTDGDIWTTTAGLFVRINGSTVGPLS